MAWVNAVVQGILTGGLYALFATGLSLAFGVMRFVNLAHGDLAILAAYLTLSTSAVFGTSYWVSIVLVVMVMAVIGYVGQRGLFNFTLGEDPLPGILVSFGVGIVIQNALQEHYTATDRSIDLGPILTKSITVNDDISIGWFPLLTLIVAVVVLVALQQLFSRTSIGRAFRATADDPQTAQLMGINDRRLYGVAMAIAFAAIALAGFFRGARTTFSPSSGGGILLFAFEAVVIGGLGSLWGTLAGGIVLGVAQGVGNQASIGWDLLAGHLVFLLILAFRPRGLLGGDADMSYRIVRTSRGSTIGTSLAVVATVFFAAFPLWGSDSTQLTLVQIFYYLSLAQMWNLLAGYAGLVTVGQQGFVGVGAYTIFVLSEQRNVDPFISIALAGLLVAALSIPVAMFAFRLQGGYFAIGTWVIAEVFRLATLRIESLGAGNVQSFTVRNTFAGYSLDARRNLIYWVSLALAVGATATVVLILRSRRGLALQAARDSSVGAECLGVNVRRTKLLMWAIAAVFTGATGALIHLNSSTVTNQDAFSVLSWTALVVFIVVIGGVGSQTGPIIGVVIFWFITDRFEDSDTWRFIILGTVAVVMAAVARRGVDGLLQRIHPFEIFPVRRQLRRERET